MSGTPRPTAAEKTQPPSVFESRRIGGHLAEVAAADDELGAVALVGGEEGRDLVGVVLAVRVERDDRVRSQVEGEPEAGPQGRALARFGTCWMTVAPAPSACVAVSSVEPSSTTTTGRWRNAPATTAAMRGPSW